MGTLAPLLVSRYRVRVARPVPEDHKARAVQLELFRRATPARRFALARSLSASTLGLAHAAIRRRHPTWSEREISLELVRVHYGADLAERLRGYLAHRDREAR
jgi:hypothetical protein